MGTNNKFERKIGGTMQNDRLASFRQALHTSFEIINFEEPIQLVLAEIADYNSTLQHEQFSLIFHGPAEPFLQQQMYTFKHEMLGELLLFIVPIGKRDEGYNYEVIFNRMVE